MNTLVNRTDALITIDLPDDMVIQNWKAESDVKQVTKRSVGGSLVVHRGLRHFGRKIVLGGDDDENWITVADADILETMYEDVNAQYTLTHNGNSQFVIFDYQSEGSPFTSKLVEQCDDPAPDHWCTFKLNLLTVV